MSTFQTISQMNTPDQIDERSHKSFCEKAIETCYTKVSTGSNPYMNYMGDEWGGTFEIWKHEFDNMFQVWTDRTSTRYHFWNITTWQEAYTIATAVISGKKFTRSETTKFVIHPNWNEGNNNDN